MIRSSWILFFLFLGFSIDNTKSLFAPWKLGLIRQFRDGFWDICSVFNSYLLQLNWWFLRNIKRPSWYKKYWNINNLVVSVDLVHIFSFQKNIFSSWYYHGYYIFVKKKKKQNIWRSEVFLEKRINNLFELNTLMIT